jgi:hypothetical protein
MPSQLVFSVSENVFYVGVNLVNSCPHFCSLLSFRIAQNGFHGERHVCHADDRKGTFVHPLKYLEELGSRQTLDDITKTLRGEHFSQTQVTILVK